jgi:hypothetical protein
VLAGKYNIVCQQGSTFDLEMTLQYPNPDFPNNCADPDNCPEYLNWDLTGYSARMQVRKYVESATTIVELLSTNLDSNRITLGGADGTITLFMRAEDTRAITQSGYYDLEIVSPSNEVDRIVEGTFTLSPEVTR